MSSHDKPCTVCGKLRSVLVRCQIDDSGAWHFLCPGSCWKKYSGGEEDARGSEDQFPHYRYGGMWKNKHDDSSKMSAKKPKKVKEKQKERRAEREKHKANADAHADEQDHDEGAEGETISAGVAQ